MMMMASAHCVPQAWTFPPRQSAAANYTCSVSTVVAGCLPGCRGLLGLVDRRAMRPSTASGRVDPRVVDAMREAIGQTKDASTRTAGFVLWRTALIIAETHGIGQVPVPSQRTLYRLFAKLSQGRHTTGTARARRSLAARPPGTFSELAALAPGELVQIDSAPLDVLVLLDDGVVGRVELTGMVDVATRSITAAILRPSTKAADATASYGAVRAYVTHQRAEHIKVAGQT